MNVRIATGPKKLIPCVRFAKHPDMPEIVGIENANFEWPWSEADFMKVQRSPEVVPMVAEFRSRVAGFIFWEELHDKVLILNIAVHASLHRRGVGVALVAKACAKAQAKRLRLTEVSVGERNLIAQLFFRAIGFRCVGTITGQYAVTNEDAYVFRYGAA